MSDIQAQTYSMIDSLKAICTNYGLGNSGNEYKVITETFLYKFLNDKFFCELKKLENFKAQTTRDIEKILAGMSADDFEMELMSLPANTAKLKPPQFISTLFNNNHQKIFTKFLTPHLPTFPPPMHKFSASKSVKVLPLNFLSRFQITLYKLKNAMNFAVPLFPNSQMSTLKIFSSRNTTSSLIFLNISSRITTKTLASTPNITRHTPLQKLSLKFWFLNL